VFIKVEYFELNMGDVTIGAASWAENPLIAVIPGLL